MTPEQLLKDCQTLLPNLDWQIDHDRRWPWLEVYCEPHLGSYLSVTVYDGCEPFYDAEWLHEYGRIRVSDVYDLKQVLRQMCSEYAEWYASLPKPDTISMDSFDYRNTQNCGVEGVMTWPDKVQTCEYGANRLEVYNKMLARYTEWYDGLPRPDLYDFG